MPTEHLNFSGLSDRTTRRQLAQLPNNNIHHINHLGNGTVVPLDATCAMEYSVPT